MSWRKWVREVSTTRSQKNSLLSRLKYVKGSPSLLVAANSEGSEILFVVLLLLYKMLY